MSTMTPFTRNKIIAMRHASENEAYSVRTEAAQNVAQHIYNIVLEYAAYGPHNSYRYQITHPKYCTDGTFVMCVVYLLRKAFPDFDVLPEAVGDGNTGVLMHNILVKW